MALLISNIGAWIQYPQHITEPFVSISAWIYFFPDVPNSIFISSAIAAIFLAFVIQKIFNPTNKLVNRKKDKYGYAKYIYTLSTLKKYFVKNNEVNFGEGIVLGKMENSFIRSTKPYSCLVLAPPGTGKTAGIVVPNLLLCENSMIIHDPKGELWELTSPAREKHLKQKVLLFDPTSTNSAKFNIFSDSILPKDRADLKAYINNVANIIFSETGKHSSSGNNDSYFQSAAKSAFTFFAQWLIEKNGETSLPKIREKLLQESDTVTTIETMIADPDTSEELKMDGRGTLIASESENQWAGVIGQLKEALDLYGDARIKSNIDSKCDFTGDLLRKEKISVYLKVKDKDKKRLKPLITMMIEAIATQLISEMPKEGDNQITYILDEFVRLGKLEAIAELPAISRGYNINTIFVAQDYEQISNTYGKEYLSIFDSNCAYKIVFRQNNLSTAERISKTVGNRTVKRKSSSSSYKNDMQLSFNSSKSVSTSDEAIALVSPQDILSLDQNQILVLVQGYLDKPILAASPLWFKEKELKKLSNN